MTDLAETYLSTSNITDFLRECDITDNTSLKKIIIQTMGLIPVNDDVSQLKILLLCNWTTTEKLMDTWNKMSKGDYRWGNIVLVTKDKNPDYYIVINKPLPGDSGLIIKKRTIVIQMEPDMHKNKDMWGEWSDPNPDHFFHILTHKLAYNNIEWHIDKKWSELSSFHPTKRFDSTISTILSEKYTDQGHIKRVDFAKFLESKGDIDLDVFGNNKWDYKSYKGSLPYHVKDKGLFPYKYTFNVENNSRVNYFTEKIVDAILSECLIFYSGCWNLKEYIDEKAFVYLELDDFEKDYNIIKDAIKNNLWEKRLPYIRKCKENIINNLQFFPRIEALLKSKHK